MNIKARTIVFAACISSPGFGLPAQAATYYVDQANAGANDTNPGSVALPWKTISKANQVLVAGDTVLIKGGTYTSTISPARSGQATAPITYKNFDASTVTIQNASYGILLDAKSYIL